jgi:glycine dehydrogenase subunit 2
MSDDDVKVHAAAGHIVRNEEVIFERSRAGKRGYLLPELDVPEEDVASLIPSDLVRDDVEGMPEVSEFEVVRHFTRLSTWNYGVDTGLYPLGSCTMKYNPKINETLARLEGFASAHPLLPERLCQGSLEIIKRLEEVLVEITGLPAISLQPAAGAHGELTAMLAIRAAHAKRGDVRKKVLIPDSAHGTNPASAIMCGYEVESVTSTSHGLLDPADIEKHMDDSVAAIMITNPNTLGKFEEEIDEVARIVHARGGFIYMDGANMNALMGVARPGDMGVDCMHLNLHKTFSTPHGGGGPGAGPICVVPELEPFLPIPRIVRDEAGALRLDFDRAESIGRVRAFFGNFGVFVRALAYILTLGPDGLREACETAVLNANYLKRNLEDVYHVAFEGPVLHEVVFTDRVQQKFGVRNADVAKRIIDYGFYPPTMSFPLIAPGAIMVEPTETESREELDLFVASMRAIAAECERDPELVKTAPHRTRVGRFDETAAARKPVLRWRPESHENRDREEQGSTPSLVSR